MNRRGNLVSYRPDVKVLDATIRDGGLMNNFYFDDEFVRALYLANVKAGVDYMEFGYKASKDIFSPDKFGKWKFCDDEDIRAIVGENNTDLKISVMADVGRTDFRRDIKSRSESVIDMVRVATYINTIPAAIEIVEYCHELGYETTVNIMAISNASDVDIDGALELLCQSHADGIYLVDSYGSLYPEQVARLSEKYLSYAEPAGKYIGMQRSDRKVQPLMYKSFECTDAKSPTFLHLSTLGYHEIYLNGERVSDDVLAPSVVEFSKRHQQ